MKKFRRIVQSSLLVCSMGMACASNEVKCICRDHTTQTPACGICGEELGIMEKTGTGTQCICNNELLNEEISCEETCSLHEGWSGEFEEE
jgi:hypothetical protein